MRLQKSVLTQLMSWRRSKVHKMNQMNQMNRMNKMNQILSSLVFALIITNSAFAASKRALQADDFYRLQAVENLSCSRDGQWIAYTVSTTDREADELRSAVWMVNWQGTEHIALTSGALSASAPQFSPDGRFVSYLAAHGEDPAQLYLLDRRGGEPRMLTSVGGEIGEYRWSPDGHRIVFSMIGLLEKPRVIAAAKPIVIDDFHFKEDISGYRSAADRSKLYLLDISTRTVQPLTSDVRYRDEHPTWSPDGSSIAYISNHEGEAYRLGTQEIYLIDAKLGATPKRLAHFYAPNKQSLLFTSDLKQIFYSVGFEPKWYAYIHDRLAVVTVANGESKVLTDALDRAVAVPVAISHGELGVLVEDDRSEYPAVLHIGSSQGSVVTRSVAAPVVTVDQCAAGGHLAVIASTDTQAPEVYALEYGKSGQGHLRPLTNHNETLLGELTLGSAEDIHFNSADGTEVHGIMIKPLGFQKGQLYPTLLWIHGGPNGQDAHGLAFDTYPLELERQWFAAHGYVVLAINYRGSSGRGADFQRSIAADWGHKEVEDLLAGVDYVVREKIADPSRLGIGGWSYGGILTDSTIASDNRFKAAISGAGSANQLSMFGSDQYALQYTEELGMPWTHLDRWLKVSYPYFHADKIKTPTLFMGGEKDFNVPIGGSEQMYQALRVLGVPTQLVVYPGEFHIFTRPSHIHDRIERYLAWFDRYLKP